MSILSMCPEASTVESTFENSKLNAFSGLFCDEKEKPVQIRTQVLQILPQKRVVQEFGYKEDVCIR